jgi:leukotriene A-4 hydrolase/aminopeptidase
MRIMVRPFGLPAFLVVLCLTMAFAQRRGGGAWAAETRDPHSYSRPDELRVTALDLDLAVDFEQTTLKGTAQWTLLRGPAGASATHLLLDTRDLTIHAARAFSDGRWQAARFTLGPTDRILGTPLSIELPEQCAAVAIEYQTAPLASALQWVAPSGTSGKVHPFLYTQSQAIHARSWIPCQDTPAVRVTYTAHIHAPRALVALMSADRKTPAETTEPLVTTEFEMREPIPSYLIALAVGHLEKRDLGPRTAVWAEHEIVDKAAWEFADTESMVEATEKRFGPYRWGRYDILVLPPSFPYGGMENPKLTFATPTVLSGDRSQVALIAHELAHSWSGNLVTNATWADFWLNEGFTTYIQNRIVEDVYGTPRADMENVLGHGELLDELKRQPPSDQILNIDLRGRDPDDGVTRIPYEKGAALLRAIEAKIGRARLDAFLKAYFDHYAFQSITTAEFERHIHDALLANADFALDLAAWIHQPGLPADAVVPKSDRFSAVEALAQRFSGGAIDAAAIDTKGWTTLEWLHFLRALPETLTSARLAELDAAHHLTATGNAEIACQWFEMAIRAGYRAADAKLAEYLRSVGRRKLIVPLYSALVKTSEGKAFAQRAFDEARAGYHPIAADTIARLLARP